MKKYLLFVFFIGFCFKVKAQNDTSRKINNFDPVKHAFIDSSAQRDVKDVLHKLLKSKKVSENDQGKKFNFSVVPSIGYSLSTGFGANLNSNVVFRNGTDRNKTNVSVISASGFIDTKNQRSLTTIANI